VSSEWDGDRWEYWVGFMFANVAHARLYDVKWEGRKEGGATRETAGVAPLDFVPQALIPVLNERGAEGWELISIQPVEVNPGHEPQTIGRDPSKTIDWYRSAASGSGGWWTHAYLCVMKRRVVR
jgi:hypothetical protein